MSQDFRVVGTNERLVEIMSEENGSSPISQRVGGWISAAPQGPLRWRLTWWKSLVERTNALEPDYRALSERELRKGSLSLRYRAKAGESLSSLLPDAYALVREAARRTIEMRHFDVQLLGGVALFYGSIAEMETGEGKTLTATLPMYLRALPGKGADLATVNDYLAKRDAEWMTPVYRLLGLSVGIIQTDMSPDDRRKAYHCDVTYGTAKEFGFDFLKDRLLLRRAGQTSQFLKSSEDESKGDQPVQRDPYFSLVDEADSILIDEARTPLIISAAPGEAQLRAVTCFKWAADQVEKFVDDEHYEYDHEKRKVELTIEGRQYARALPRPKEMDPVGLVTIYEYLERAIKVSLEFFVDKQFVVKDDEVVIVDEFTGRMSEGRKWSGGIHQAVEAKEGAEVTVETGHAARITVQDFFLRYEHLAGMTGTAATSAREIRKIYKVNVIPIPTNRPIRRQRLPQRVYGTSDEKWAAVVDEIRQLHEQGRPVLVGTRSIDKSEILATLLKKEGIEHRVLNARHVAAEAEIVSEAGQPGIVTVATNMAGRGTDIKLGEGIAEAGGLHVICTEMHDSARIDRQLMGRCGRQGDPGTQRQYVALDDELLRTAYGPKKAEKYKQLGRRAGGGFDSRRSLFRRAQRRVERQHFRGRRILLHHEKQRKKMQREMVQDPYLDTAE
jgi:preprotein translocase subunit SecA